MCVIFICEDKRPSEGMVSKAYEWNDQGGGVAWIDGKSVKWKKGLSEEEMQDACRTLPLPYVAHYRIASSGLKVPELCHPFPLHRDVSTGLEGRTTKGVMFHNGTWVKWKEWSMEALVRKNLQMPDGLWNDTRAMAWMAALYGVPILELIDEKAAVVTPEGIQFFGKGWSTKDGIVVSNEIFLNQSRQWSGHHGGSSGTALRERLDATLAANREKAAAAAGTGGASRSLITFPAGGVPLCGSGAIVLPGRYDEDPVQETLQGVSEGDGESEGDEQPASSATALRHPIDIALENLRRERGDEYGMIAMGPTRPTVGPKAIFKTVDEAVLEGQRERQRRIDSARRGITYMGDM